MVFPFQWFKYQFSWGIAHCYPAQFRMSPLMSSEDWGNDSGLTRNNGYLFSRWKLSFFANKLVNHRTKWAIVSMTILYLQWYYQRAMNFVEHHARIGNLWPNLFVMKCWCQWFLAISWSSCHVISWAGNLQGPWCGLTGWLVASDQMHPLLNFSSPLNRAHHILLNPFRSNLVGCSGMFKDPWNSHV